MNRTKHGTLEATVEAEARELIQYIIDEIRLHSGVFDNEPEEWDRVYSYKIDDDAMSLYFRYFGCNDEELHAMIVKAAKSKVDAILAGNEFF